MRICLAGLYLLLGLRVVLACTRPATPRLASAVNQSALSASTGCLPAVSVSPAVLEQALTAFWQQHPENRFTQADYARWRQTHDASDRRQNSLSVAPTDYALFAAHAQHFQYEHTYWRLKTPDGRVLYHVRIEVTGPGTCRLCVYGLRLLAPRATAAGNKPLSEAEQAAACQAIQTDLGQKLPALPTP